MITNSLEHNENVFIINYHLCSAQSVTKQCLFEIILSNHCLVPGEKLGNPVNN